jgi:hypothetical protein
MKFHWGTGILIFLILFLLAAGFFIAFAMRQDISLVHEDYYERGVNHSSQIKIEERSAALAGAVYTKQDRAYLKIGVDSSLSTRMDSAFLLLFRPSNQSLDIKTPFDPSKGELLIPKKELELGRYILKLSWSFEGLKYEIQETVVIN